MAGGLPRGIVVLLAQTEIDEQRFIVGTQQNVGGLHVEVHHLVLVDEAKGLGHLEDIARGFDFAEVALTAHFSFEGTIGGVLHDVVGRVVLLEHADDAHNIGVLQLGDMAGLLEELVVVAGHEFGVAARG